MTQITTMPVTTQRSSTEYLNSSMAMPVQMVEHEEPTKSSASEQFLGELIDGTYCSRIFTDCDKKKCRLQSPNFPGLYPRNLTCYYAVSIFQYSHKYSEREKKNFFLSFSQN